ncbi:MAG: energy transducer TonB [Gemmatimonadales bacterium]
MNRRHRPVLPVLAALSVACGRPDGGIVKLPADAPAPDRRDDSPVAINGESPVEYPTALFEQGIEGKVLLRLHTDEQGVVVDDSTRIAESSGYPALDSAALVAAPRFRFAPALHNGAPVAATFLQPVHFRHPQRGGTTP